MKQNIYIIGDVHGSYKPFKDFSQSIDLNNSDNTLICLGDFGGNFFFNYRDKNFKEKLNKYNLTYFVVRGNHEQRPSLCVLNDPNDWHTEIFWGNKVYVENNYPYIKYALDYPAEYFIPIGNNLLNTLVLPGAYSVDKYYRLAQGWTWFSQEQCTPEEMAAGVDLAQSHTWDLVLSHTCPAIYEPTDLFFKGVDQSTVDKTTERWLGQIEYNLNYTLWTFGHYHQTRIYPKHENKQMLMLFNDIVLDINKYFSNKDIYNSLISIN